MSSQSNEANSRNPSETGMSQLKYVWQLYSNVNIYGYIFPNSCVMFVKQYSDASAHANE